MKRVVNALGGSLRNSGIGPFTATVKGNQYKVTVFCIRSPDIKNVNQAVKGANTTAVVTCTWNQGQWEVTVTWIEPDTSKDETIARALQEQENAGGGGSAVGCGSSSGAVCGVGMGINPANVMSDSYFECWLAAGGGASRDDGGAGCGDHGAISALQQARNMWQEQTDAKFACAGGHGGAGIGHTDEMTDAQFAEWLAKGGGSDSDGSLGDDSANGHHGVYPTTIEELRKMDL